MDSVSRKKEMNGGHSSILIKQAMHAREQFKKVHYWVII